MPESNQHKKSSVKILSFDAPDLLALLICAGIFFAWFNLLLDKFIFFGYYDWDLAIYANAMWALTHGSFHGSLWGTNFLTNHAEYISILITPIYALFPSAFTLIILKLLSLITGGFVLYRIGKERIGWPLGLGVMLLYFAFPANFFMLIFEFHFESLAIVFLFLVYYYLHVRAHYVKFILCCILASLCKENIPTVIFMFGFMSLFHKNGLGQKFAWTAMGIGAGIFISEMLIVTPFLRHLEGMVTTSSPYVGLYWDGQQNPGANIIQLCSQLFNPWNATYLGDLFFPLLLIPLLGFKTLLIALPLFLQALLSSTQPMHAIYYHYAATLSPFLFLAALEVLNWSRKRFTNISAIILIFLLAGGIVVNWSYHAERFQDRIAQWKDRDDLTRIALLKYIPPNASVIGTFEFLNRLADRKDVYPLRNVWLNSNPFHPQSDYVVPSAQYALIDWNCPWLWGETVTPKRDETIKRLTRLKNFYLSGNWQVKAAEGEITLLEKTTNTSAETNALLDVQKTPFPIPKDNGGATVHIDNKFQLLYSETGEESFKNFSSPLTTITFYWKADAEINDLYIIDLTLLNKWNKPMRTWRHHIGYGVYPTPIWQQGDYIKEKFWINSMSLPEGEYTIRVDIGNFTEDHWAKMNDQTQYAKKVPIGSIKVRTLEGGITHEK